MEKNDMKNLLYRFFSAVVFIPFIITPILFKGYFLFVFYIFIISLMVDEILNMISIAKTKIYLCLYLFISIFTIFLFIVSISAIDNISLKIIEIIFTIWLFDTFCYLGGKTFNGKKLMPNISKGKTFNGLYSGVIVTILISSIYYFIIYNELNMLIILTIPVIILSFIGDLIVSVLKRSVKLKDSGNIIPGHGGIVDRMDSFILVFFSFGIYLLIFVN